MDIWDTWTENTYYLQAKQITETMWNKKYEEKIGRDKLHLLLIYLIMKLERVKEGAFYGI